MEALEAFEARLAAATAQGSHRVAHGIVVAAIDKTGMTRFTLGSGSHLARFKHHLTHSLA